MTAVAFRVLWFLVLITIGASALTYFITRDRRWLRFGWQLFKYSVVLALIILAFVVLERVILAI